MELLVQHAPACWIPLENGSLEARLDRIDDREIGFIKTPDGIAKQAGL